MNKDVKAIIFDLDGTLVNSEPLQYQAFNEVFSRYAHPVSPEEYDRGRGWQVVPQWIEARGLTLQPDSIREQIKHPLFEAADQSHLGVKSFLEVGRIFLVHMN